MTNPGDLIHDAEDKVEDLIHEAEEGESARTPLIAITGVTLVIAAAAAIMIVVLLVLYYSLK
jgi:type VI protein secretion system component VasF